MVAASISDAAIIQGHGWADLNALDLFIDLTFYEKNTQDSAVDHAF